MKEIKTRMYVLMAQEGLWPAEPTLDIAAWAGFGGVRDEIMWENIETSKGQYAMPEAQQNFIDGLRERNLKMLYIAAGANPLYGLSWKQWFLQLPNTEEAINGYANYCGWFCRGICGCSAGNRNME